jgi:hypothetical protein
MVRSSLQTEEKIEGCALIAAPVLFAASTFYWHNGEYNVISATLLILSLFFWLPALRGLFSITSVVFPRYSILALRILISDVLAEYVSPSWVTLLRS